MASSTFSGPLRAGTKPLGSDAPNVGNVVLSQTAIVSFDATLVQSATINLPANSQILTMFADVLTAYNSATSATLTVGTAAAGTQYAGSVNAKTAGRAVPTFTAAQLAAMANIGSTTTVVTTVTSVGQPTAGQVRVTVQYVQV